MSELFDRVRKRSHEIGDCWEWQGAMQHANVTPMINWKGKPQAVRRLIAMELGLSLTKKIATVRCMNRLCVNPDHVQTLTRKLLQSRTAKNHPAVMSPARMMRIAIKARAKAKLDLEKAREIRRLLEEGKTQRAVAELYNVSQNCISRIHREVIWRDYTNPFLQLMR